MPDLLPQHPPAFERPSDEALTGCLGEPECIGDRLPLAGRIEDERLGNAVHGFLAYAEILPLATGKPVSQCFFHLPVSGLVVPLMQEIGRPTPDARGPTGDDARIRVPGVGRPARASGVGRRASCPGVGH